VKIWTSIFAVLALLALTWTTTEAQEVADTVVVTIEGDLNEVSVAVVTLPPHRIGDTIFFRAEAFDSEGDPVVSVLYRWASEDTTVLALEELEDGQARGIALRKGTIRVWVMAEPITSLDIAILREDGSLDWGRQLTLTALGESAQLCAYLHRRGYLVAESPGPPACPVVFLAPPDPNGWPAVIRRVVPWSQLQRYATRVE